MVVTEQFDQLPILLFSGLYNQALQGGGNSWVAATMEGLSLHVDMETRKVCPFPDDIADNLAVMKTTHSRLSKPAALGRSIGIPSKTETGLLASSTRH